MLKASVIICTHNRSYYLSEIIEHLLSQTVSEFEIIIVNNASDDNTEDVILSFKEKHNNVVYIHEPRLGLSYARNAGLRVAQGSIVAFLDDDETPVPEWLESHLRCYEMNTNVVAAGGKIELRWITPRPVWLPDILNQRLGQFNMGPEVGPLSFPKYPFGGNMSFKKDILNQLGGFSVSLGLKGQKRYANEEKEIFSKIDRLNTDAVVYYSPLAMVYHKVDPSTLKLSYFFMRQYLQGVSDILLRQNQEDPLPSRLRWCLRSAHAFLKSFLFFLKDFFFLITFNKRQHILCHMDTAYWLGYGKECLKTSLLNKKS